MASLGKKEADDRLKEVLICKVEQLPASHDKSNAQFKDSKYKASLFSVIAADLGCTAIEAQTWWRSLRDAFTSEKRLRQVECVSGKRADKRKPFRFYEAMSFWLPYLRKRRSLTTVGNEQDTCDMSEVISTWDDENSVDVINGIINDEGNIVEVIELESDHSYAATETSTCDTSAASVAGPSKLKELTIPSVPGLSKVKELSISILSSVEEKGGLHWDRSKSKKDCELNTSLTQALSALDKAVSGPQTQKSPETLLGESIGMTLLSIANKDSRIKWKRKFRELLSDMEEECQEQQH